MTEIGYNTVMDVVTSWDRLKNMADYEEKAGYLICTRMFEINPDTRKLFKFPTDGDIREDPKFHAHACVIFQMIDFAVSFLGPDMEMLKEDLESLGKRHIHYGVKEEYLPIMEKAVIYTLEELQGQYFTKVERKSWEVIFQYLIAQMTVGMNQSD